MLPCHAVMTNQYAVNDAQCKGCSVIAYCSTKTGWLDYFQRFFATLSHDVACQLSEVNCIPMSLLNMF